MFGSRVYGTNDAESDWDFIVVVEESPLQEDNPTQKVSGMDISVVRVFDFFVIISVSNRVFGSILLRSGVECS